MQPLKIKTKIKRALASTVPMSALEALFKELLYQHPRILVEYSFKVHMKELCPHLYVNTRSDDN